MPLIGMMTKMTTATVVRLTFDGKLEMIAVSRGHTNTASIERV